MRLIGFVLLTNALWDAGGKIMSIDNLKISDLKGIFKCDKMSISEAIPVMKIFAAKHTLTDKEALKAFGMAKKLFDDN